MEKMEIMDNTLIDKEQGSLLFCHPILNLQAWYPFKVFEIAKHPVGVLLRQS